MELGYFLRSDGWRNDMATKDPIDWMLSDAIGTLARAERLHQQFLKLRPMVGTYEPSWEPPIDVLETDREVLILIALPGVDPDDVEALIDEGVLIVSGRRVLPPELRYAATRFATNGCIGLRLAKSA